MKKKIYFFMIAVIMMFLLPINTEASFGFTKKVQHPSNQVGDGEALKLLMKPGQKQQVAVELENYEDKDITVLVNVSGARTNGNGGLEYSPNEFSKDKTMKYDLTDLVKAPSEVVVPAKGKANLMLDITMPNVAYDGIVTGGVQLMAKDQEENKSELNGAAIQNKMAFLFGVTLFNDEKDVAPDFELRKAYASQENYRNAMTVDIANIKPKLAKAMTLNVDITKKGKKEVLYTRKKTDVSMAPNSLMNFPVSLNGELMEAGKYTAHVLLKGYGEEWQWTEDFTVTDEQADQFNQSDVYAVQERGVNIKLIIIIVVSVLVLGAIIYFVLKSNRKDKKDKTDKTTKKRKKVNKK